MRCQVQAPRDSGVVATNVDAPVVALVNTDAAGGKLKVIAFSGGGDEEFWLGEELRVGGSSKGKRITVNWLKCDHGVYVREIEDSTSIYYIGEVSVDDKEMINFDFDILPEGDDRTLLVRFSHQFYTR